MKFGTSPLQTQCQLIWQEQKKSLFLKPWTRLTFSRTRSFLFLCLHDVCRFVNTPSDVDKKYIHVQYSSRNTEDSIQLTSSLHLMPSFLQLPFVDFSQAYCLKWHHLFFWHVLDYLRLRFHMYWDLFIFFKTLQPAWRSLRSLLYHRCLMLWLKILSRLSQHSRLNSEWTQSLSFDSSHWFLIAITQSL